MLTVYGITHCDSVKRARKWLAEGHLDYCFHDFRKAGIDRATLDRWADKVGWEALLNRRGTTYRKLSAGEKTGIDRAAAIRLMVAQPALIKRPVIVAGDDVVVGFDQPAIAALERHRRAP